MEIIDQPTQPDLGSVGDMLVLALTQYAHVVQVTVFPPFVIVTLVAAIRADRKQDDFQLRIDFANPADDLERAKFRMHPPFVTSFGQELYRVSLQAGGLNICFKRSANLFLKIKFQNAAARSGSFSDSKGFRFG